MIYLFALLTALVLSMALIPPFTKLAQHFSIVDVPNERKVNVCVIPRAGGVAMALGAMIPILLWVPMDRVLVSLLIAILVILVFGVWDDRSDIDYRLKFLGQLIAIFIVVFPGGVVIEKIPFFGFDPIPLYCAIPLTIIALLGITNAINLADGLDGLAGGVTLLSFCGVAILAFISGNIPLTLFILAVLGGLVGFLRYNTWPAQLFMGDAGSQFLGFTLGVAVIMLTLQAQAAMSPVVGLLILGVPLLDTLTVMLQRIRNGLSPFAADRNHVHHKLLDLGFDHYGAVFLIYIAQAALVTLAYLFRYESDIFLVGIYLLFCLIVWLSFYWAKVNRWSLKAKSQNTVQHLAFTGRWANYLRITGGLQKSTYFAISGLISLFLLTVASLAVDVPKDFGLMASVLFLMLMVSLLTKGTRLSVLQQIVVCGTSILMVYLLTVYPGHFFIEYEFLVNSYFIVLALIVIVAIRFSWDKVFRVTPLDFLIIFLAIVVPNLPDTHFQEVGMSVAKIIVLFYGVEFVLRMATNKKNILNIAVLVTLAVVALRGIA